MNIRRFLASFEVCVGIIGIGQLIVAIFLPAALLFFSSIPLILLGMIGVFELRSLYKSETKRSFIFKFSIMSVLIFYMIYFVFKEGSSILQRALPLIGSIFFPFFNTFVFLPFFFKLAIIVLLTLHFALLNFSQYDRGKSWKIAFLLIIIFEILALTNIVQLEAKYASIFNTNNFLKTELSSGIFFNQAYIFEKSSTGLSGSLHGLKELNVVKHHYFKAQGTPYTDLFINIGIAPTASKAKQCYDKYIDSLNWLKDSDISRKNLDFIVEGEGFIVVRDNSYDAFVRIERGVIHVNHQSSSEKGLLSTKDFDLIIKSSVKNSKTK